MEQLQISSFLLAPIAPFIAAALAPLMVRFAGHHAGWLLALVPAAIFAQFLMAAGFLTEGGFVIRELWIATGSPTPIYYSLFVDGLSLVFALLISGIGTFIVIYAGGYLKGHRHQGRFMAFILMFMGSMLGLVLANDIITLFVFWELTSVTSFLLIGFDNHREKARRAAMQALVITGGGGLALLAGLIMMAYAFQTWDISAMLGANQGLAGQELYLPILLLVLAGAFTKSAQVPFHFWLPNAMEAPTPVSAYLHSATMVKAGVYLVARFHPILGNSPEWNIILPVFGGLTVLTGALLALRQTDMKQMLAYTTMGSLGMLIMLIGVGTEVALSAAILFLIAHSFYKGALFMIAGTIDHGTGSRDITALGGLATKMPISFVSAILAAVSMAGLPFALGYFAKEEIYALVAPYEGEAVADFAYVFWQNAAVVAVAFIGNGLMLVVGAAIALKPFLGNRRDTPIAPHEGSLALIIGSLLLGVVGYFVGFYIHDFGGWFVSPAASPVYGLEVENHLETLHFALVPLTLSVLTWAFGVLVFMNLDRVRAGLEAFGRMVSWGPDKGFDQAMRGLLHLCGFVTRLLHHGRLEFYMVLVFVGFAAALFGPIAAYDLWPAIPELPDLRFYEWGIAAIAALGVMAVLAGQTRLVAIVSLGIQGFAVAFIFLLFGAPDLGFTQFMVETLSVVIIALVMTRLHLDQHDNRLFEQAIRDGFIAITGGVGITIFMVVVLGTEIDLRLSDFFTQTSVAIAHGHNIVNVILVDYRGLDTLGEITVVMTAGIAILALVRIRAGGRKTGSGALPRAVAPPMDKQAGDAA